MYIFFFCELPHQNCEPDLPAFARTATKGVADEFEDVCEQTGVTLSRSLGLKWGGSK